MKVSLTARSLAEIPSESVVGQGAVIQFAGIHCRLKRRGGDKFVVLQCLIPTIKVLNGRVDVVLAIDEVGRRVVNFEKSPAFFSVAGRPIPYDRPCFVVELRVVHAARPENPLLQEHGKPLSGDFLRDKSQQYIARVAILELLARRKTRLLLAGKDSKHIMNRRFKTV